MANASDESFSAALAFYNSTCEDTLLSLEDAKSPGVQFRTLETFSRAGDNCAYKGLLLLTSVTDEAWEKIREDWLHNRSEVQARQVALQALSVSLVITPNSLAGSCREAGGIASWITDGDSFRQSILFWASSVNSDLTQAFSRAVSIDPMMDVTAPPQGGLSVYQRLDAVLKNPLLREDALEALPLVMEWASSVSAQNKMQSLPGQEKETALWLSSAYGMAGFMRLLVDHCDVDINAGQGSALRWAAERGQEASVDFALSRRADVYLSGSDGDTAVTLARQNGHQGLAQKIEAYGLVHNPPSENGRQRRPTMPPRP